MLNNTFMLLNGIGQKLEKRLWKRGILTWEDFIDSGSIDFLPGEKKRAFDNTLKSAIRHLDERNSFWFESALGKRERWRMFEHFRDGAVYLDIETNGFMPESGGYPTMIGIYDGFDYKCLIRGRDLDCESLNKELSGHKLIITFFGSVFDMPYLEKSLGFKTDLPHLDLCFAARNAGLRGGLKTIERKLGISRDGDIDGMDGYGAVLLWREVEKGSDYALSTLQNYNKADTVNLMHVASHVCGTLKHLSGISEYMN